MRITVVKYKERKQRFFSEITNLGQLYTILKTKYNQKSLKIKYDIEGREAHFNEFRDDSNTVMVVTDETYQPGTDNLIIVSGLLEKYFEVDLLVEERKSDGYFRCSIHGGRVATTGRADLRFKVNEGDAVATNFRFSKYSIELNNFTLPTSIKVILDQHESSKRSQADVYEVCYFDQEDPIGLEIKKTMSTFLIADLNDSMTFSAPMDGFLDPKKVLADRFDQYVIKAREKGYTSVMMVPIIYITESESAIPFAYIRMMSKSKRYGIEDTFAVKEETFKLIDRIREANTVLLSEKQHIVDISRGGVRLRIDNEELKRYLIKSRGFVFDIVFKLQAPITIYGEIRFTGQDEDNNLLLGICFVGNSSRKDQMKHLYEILEPMEIEYKKRLIMQMRHRQQAGAKKP